MNFILDLDFIFRIGLFSKNKNKDFRIGFKLNLYF